MTVPKPVAIAVLSAFTMYGVSQSVMPDQKKAPPGAPSQATQQAADWQDARNEQRRRQGQAEGEAIAADRRRPREERRPDPSRAARGLLRRIP